MENAGKDLYELRRMRNWADYDFGRSLHEATAIDYVALATDIVQLFHQLANEAAILTRVLDAIKRYERDVLREVTWHA